MPTVHFNVAKRAVTRMVAVLGPSDRSLLTSRARDYAWNRV